MISPCQFGEDSKRHLPPTPPYASLKPPAPTTRSSGSTDTQCTCRICEVARMKNSDQQKHTAEQSNPMGYPKTKLVSPPARTIPVCSKCFSMIGKGVPHNCTKVQRQENLSTYVKSTSTKSKGKVTSNILKDICSETGVSKSGGVVSLATGGAPLPVQVGKSKQKAKDPRFTIESLKRLQAAHNFSDKTTK